MKYLNIKNINKMEKILNKKRHHSLENFHKESKLSDIQYERNSKVSPNSRDITFIDVQGKDITIYINTKSELKKQLPKFKFNRPYYIDDQGKEILINNIGNFFHLSNIDKIYNLKGYKNEIMEENFNEQYECIPNNISKETLYLNKFFFKSYYYKYHTKNYAYLALEYDIYFTDVREICSSTEKNKKIVEIFRKKKTGITTFLNVYFSQLRTRIRTKERFIPFIIFDYDRLLNLKKFEELINLLNLNIINLFVSYKYYNEFCSKVYLEIAKFGFDIDNIIISIIDLYIKHIEKFNMAYVPCIIIDNYNPENNELYNKLLLSQAKNDFRIIMVYKLKSPTSNKIITDYLDDKKKESFEFKYTKTLYSKIEKLPNKYENIFKEMIPTIYNYLKINNCKSEKDAKKFLKDEEKDIISEIQTFYNDNISKMNLYLNEISILIGKELNIKNDFIKNIFLNTPLNVFDLTILENSNITINYASKSVKKIVYDIRSSSIIDLLPKLNDLNLDNFVKGGIFERRIKELLKKKKPIFGMIDNIVQFDCILNYFKAKKNYEFSPVEIDDNLKKLKNIKKLVEKYKNYTYNNNIMIVQEQNGKDWDFSIIYKDDNNNNVIHLYLV